MYNFLNMQNLNIISISDSVRYVIIGTFVSLSFISLPLIAGKVFTSFKLQFKIFNKNIKLFPFSLKWYSIFILICAILCFFRQIGIKDYILNQFSKTNIYEDYYVSYEDGMVDFPEKKRNLIYIYIESFENSVFSIDNGGLKKESYAPNLEKMATDSEYLNFSNNDKIGGFKTMTGTNWTASAMVAQTAGIPIYINTKNDKNEYLSGAVSIGEILKNNGYNNYLMMGSDADFAERRNYFSEHGNYEILDYQQARLARLIPYDYFVWWGYEDSKLYELAKNKLTYISQSDEPFNFTMLTADTHYFDGYTDDSCPKVFDNNYANSFYCMDLQLSQFISWIKEQDFYENTTIVIVGDHLAMRSDVFATNDSNYTRTIFNLFINSEIKVAQNKNRNFTAFDMLPTTLASIGCSIDGERLALGTNLFSNEKTLAEEIGYENFNNALRKNSNYYKHNILYKKN